MLNTVISISAGLMLVSGVALADPDGDLTNPSTTGTGAMEQPSSQIDDAGPSEQGALTDRAWEDGVEPKIGSMGAGVKGTTGGMGSTTGTDSIEDPEDEAQQ